MTDAKTKLLAAKYDFATWVAKRSLEAVQNKAMLEKQAPPVVALGLLISVETLLRQGEAAYRESGFDQVADNLAEALKGVILVERSMRTMVRDEVEIAFDRRPELKAVPIAPLGSVVVGMTEE